MSKASEEEAIQEEVDYGLSNYEKDTDETNNTEGMDLDQPVARKDHEARAERQSTRLGARSSFPFETDKRLARFVANDPSGYERLMQEAMATMNKNIANRFANLERQFDQRNRQFTSEERGKGRATEGDFDLSKKRQSASDRPSLAHIIVPWWPKREWWPLLRAPNGASWAPYVIAERCLNVKGRLMSSCQVLAQPIQLWWGHQSGLCMPCVWTSEKSSEHGQNHILKTAIVSSARHGLLNTAILLTGVMPVLRDDAKELAGNRHADIEQLLQLLPEALSGAKADSTMRRYVPLWVYSRDWCTGHDLPFLSAAPLTVALYPLKLAQTANSFSTMKLASAAIAAFHGFASQSEVTRAPIVAAIRECARRTLSSSDNRMEPSHSL